MLVPSFIVIVFIVSSSEVLDAREAVQRACQAPAPFFRALQGELRRRVVSAVGGASRPASAERHAHATAFGHA
jgi:hypothetical protein